MIIPRWKDPHRRRSMKISWNSPDYAKYYDLDVSDFTQLTKKIHDGQDLSEMENDRYGVYILTTCIAVLGGPKFVLKPKREKEQIIEQQYLELLCKLPKNFDEGAGSIHSYAYRIAYTSAIHYYEDLTTEYHKEKKIQDHLDTCMEDYLAEVREGKTEAINE